jgi:hypothetical protein
MKKTTRAFLFELPAMILLVILVIGAFYAKISGVYPMRWATPITVLVIVALFFIGKYLAKRARDNPYL